MRSPASELASASRSCASAGDLSRSVLAGLVGLVGMSASWLKAIERGTRLPPRLPLLVKLAEALAVG